MPILPAEPELHPDGLFDAPPTPGSGVWWALHTKPRQEKSLARWLVSGGIDFYLPTIDRRSRIRGRIVTSRIPLFPGYVFLLANRDGRLQALTSNRVVRCLEAPDQDKIWDDLRQIYQLIASGLPVLPEERLTPGMPVEVSSGPLSGLRGTIVRHASGRRFVVRVDFIQQGASVLLDDCALIPLGPAPVCNV